VPELPEVETVANGVHARAQGQQVLSAWFSHYPRTFLTRSSRMAKVLPGLRIQLVRRVGKHIVLDLGTQTASNPTVQWIVHLGMTGRLLYCESTAPVAPHTHARLELNSGYELRFVDPRRFGRLDLIDLAKKPAFIGPGTEPLTIQPAEFAALFHGRKTPIKAALLNQSLLHGVGNIYADEGLFHAGIRPLRHAGASRSKRCCSRPSPSADLPYPIMWMPMVSGDSSSLSTASIYAPGSPVGSAENPFKES